ncbi:hypothetical protein BJX61DRAFT_504631 [Aspergillus egyptiacus]|nr:hypothetical protein BJX61DRAFT_504631 [Aspergillus egyptiacus]
MSTSPPPLTFYSSLISGIAAILALALAVHRASWELYPCTPCIQHLASKGMEERAMEGMRDTSTVMAGLLVHCDDFFLSFSFPSSSSVYERACYLLLVCVALRCVR